MGRSVLCLTGITGGPVNYPHPQCMDFINEFNTFCKMCRDLEP